MVRIDAYAAIAELLHKSQIEDLLSKQFLYVDGRWWDLLRTEIFATGLITMDNGDGPLCTTSDEIVSRWQQTLGSLDAVLHQVGHYVITILNNNMAHAVTYGTATHYKASATQGHTRVFAGNYEFNLVFSYELGWRIKGLKFTLMFMDGNLSLT
ncbi:hypothetical protein VYU27_009889 [Nannochloropsis oceanica]